MDLTIFGACKQIYLITIACSILLFMMVSFTFITRCFHAKDEFRQIPSYGRTVEHDCSCLVRLLMSNGHCQVFSFFYVNSFF